mmetsp:Transcript_15297/g.39461  ORF Transcript_15297/g.39461 Transcript_15297/m.39461 type:complete len:204 (-) Transcript_15297:261-872(-)
MRDAHEKPGHPVSGHADACRAVARHHAQSQDGATQAPSARGDDDTLGSPLTARIPVLVVGRLFGGQVEVENLHLLVAKPRHPGQHVRGRDMQQPGAQHAGKTASLPCAGHIRTAVRAVAGSEVNLGREVEDGANAAPEALCVFAAEPQPVVREVAKQTLHAGAARNGLLQPQLVQTQLELFLRTLNGVLAQNADNRPAGCRTA